MVDNIDINILDAVKFVVGAYVVVDEDSFVVLELVFEFFVLVFVLVLFGFAESHKKLLYIPPVVFHNSKDFLLVVVERDFVLRCVAAVELSHFAPCFELDT